MFLLTVALGLGLVWLATKLGLALARRRRLTIKFDKLPGPPTGSILPPHPLLEAALWYLTDRLSVKKIKVKSFAKLYALAHSQCKLFEDTGIFRWYLGFKPVAIIFSPENVESVLQSTSVTDKSAEYFVFEPWLGQGLVTSAGAKWHFRRKLLTPAFHFRILSDFVPVMNDESAKLVRKLNSAKYLEPFDLTGVISLCTLDTICETAMGVNLDCQANEDSDYVRALHEVGELGVARVCRPWLWSDWAFYRSELGKRFARSNKVLHDFTRGVIASRRDEWLRMLAAKEADGPGRAAEATLESLLTSTRFKAAHKRLAFLDLLMHQHLVEHTLSLEDIREEVDTFMFAGHDTTAINISWTLYMLGLHEHIQERVQRELDAVLSSAAGEPDDRLRLDEITVEHLARMKYLDMVVKETLRMFPSIPFIARQMTSDLLVGGKYLIPEGATCMVFTHALHHNSAVFPRPELFDPDRFLPENVAQRHPFSYVPFSAGPRNCIGQKFAKIEVKLVLAKLLRNYHVKSLVPVEKLTLIDEMVLRAVGGLHVKLAPRNGRLMA